jgi:hypothetical protein
MHTHSQIDSPMLILVFLQKKKKKKKKKKNAWNSPKYSYLMVIYSPQLSEKPPKKLEKKREKKNG